MTRSFKMVVVDGQVVLQGGLDGLLRLLLESRPESQGWSQLALGGCPPPPSYDPWVRGLSPQELGVCGWPEPAAWRGGGPCNDQLFYTPRKNKAHLQKPGGVR